MSRVVTASEVDRLHQQVAELQKQVVELQGVVLSQPASPPQDEVELFEDLEVVDSQETRSNADPVVDALASSELRSAI